MIQMINKLKKNQKGFTLVELIVVLVILAILAAFTIPAMLGFVNDARGKAAIAEAREIYVAAQSSGTELAASSPTGLLAVGSSTNPTPSTPTDADKIKIKIIALLNNDIPNIATGANLRVGVGGGVTGDALAKGNKNYAIVSVDTDGTVKEVQYTDSTGKYKVTIKTDTDGNNTATSEEMK